MSEHIAIGIIITNRKKPPQNEKMREIPRESRTPASLEYATVSRAKKVQNRATGASKRANA
jgi:hypothetical protein